MRYFKIIIWAFFLAVISFFVYQDFKPEVVYFHGFEREQKAFRKFWNQENNNLEIVYQDNNAFLKTNREISVFDFFFIDSPLEEFLDIEVRFKRNGSNGFLLGIKKSPFWADYEKFSLGEPAFAEATADKPNSQFIVGEVKNLRLADYYLDAGRSLDFWLIAPGIEGSNQEVLVDYIKIKIRRKGISNESIAKSFPYPLYSFLKENFYKSK